MHFCYFIFVFFCWSVAWSSSLSLEDSLEFYAEKVTLHSMNLEYETAFSYAKKMRQKDEGLGCIFENIIRVSLFDDKGDTTALKNAGVALEKCKAKEMWEALRMFELGYVQSELGHSVKGALKTRSAAKIFEDSKELEAKAFYAIYAYYIDKSFSWVPFKSDHRQEYLSVLDSASQISKKFWPLFLTPLIWMHYDNENFSQGLKLAERGLKKVPNHPVFLQIKADMLYRLKQYDEAAKIYEKSATDYLERTGKSIRYWCAVLNLIRIYRDKGDAEKEKLYREKINTPEFKEIKNWMPSSLMNAL